MTAISIVKWVLLITISVIFILICIFKFKECNYIKKQEIQIYKGSIKYIQTLESNSEFINDYFPKWLG